MLFLLLVMVSMAVASSEIKITTIPGAGKTACQHTVPSEKPIKSILDVDWCNFDYNLFQLKRGHAEGKGIFQPNAAHARFHYSLEGVTYGDLGGDGVNEAVVILSEKMSIPTQSEIVYHESTFLLIFRYQDGAVEKIGNFNLPYPIHAVGIGSKALLVESGNGPEQSTHRWIWDGKTFIEAPGQ